MWKDIWVHLQGPETFVTAFYIPVHKALNLLVIRKLMPLLYTSPHTDPLVGATLWHIARNAKFPLKYSDLVNAVTTCPVCSKQSSRQLPKTSGPPTEFPTSEELPN